MSLTTHVAPKPMCLRPSRVNTANTTIASQQQRQKSACEQIACLNGDTPPEVCSAPCHDLERLVPHCLPDADFPMDSGIVSTSLVDGAESTPQRQLRSAECNMTECTATPHCTTTGKTTEVYGLDSHISDTMSNKSYQIHAFARRARVTVVIGD